MKHLAAYLLLVAGGKEQPSANEIKTLLSSVGVETEESRLNALLKSLEGKTIAQVIAEGSEKLASVPTGGAVAAAGAAAGGAAAEEAAAEEKKEEEKEESDEDMGFGLFD
ncbi:60S acidic ribosomal protein P2 [Apophysomyces ossiformis]|uniref:60S acidic ribosomal protein P2 n=1 Tax=Apophysomyces ossiformis TaxID=679940 RepID=A0A8H7BU44_9FUNG|nr:60S acidic ribosomal protein P2 [Apophysomyces ossiformis]